MRSATEGLWLLPVGRHTESRAVATTSDGGATWTAGAVLPISLNLSARRLIGVGDQVWLLGEDASSGQAILSSSSDGGRSWQARTLPLAADVAPPGLAYGPVLNDITFADALHGWIVGSQGLVLATSDGGVTWVRQASGSRQNLQTVRATSAQSVWIGGSANSILATVGGGR
jgi:photosystem II stability/assembly factor-like uncharacterized protein